MEEAMKDVVAAGRQAWLDGKGRADCPYPDEYEPATGLDPVDYWASPAGMRQRWLGGYNRASVNNEIICKYGTLPVFEWQPQE
jgi:ribosome modulation factor